LEVFVQLVIAAMTTSPSLISWLSPPAALSGRTGADVGERPRADR